MWQYAIGSHVLTQNSVLITNVVYSGYPPYLDDVSAIHIVGKGPLPPGDYTLLAAFDSDLLGPLAIPLNPEPTNLMYNRGGFFAHGDSLLRPGMGSHGCLVMPHEIRVKMSASLDRLLRVVA